jgi:hypothetical protein
MGRLIPTRTGFCKAGCSRLPDYGFGEIKSKLKSATHGNLQFAGEFYGDTQLNPTTPASPLHPGH